MKTNRVSNIKRGDGSNTQNNNYNNNSSNRLNGGEGKVIEKQKRAGSNSKRSKLVNRGITNMDHVANNYSSNHPKSIYTDILSKEPFLTFQGKKTPNRNVGNNKVINPANLSTSSLETNDAAFAIKSADYYQPYRPVNSPLRQQSYPSHPPLHSTVVNNNYIGKAVQSSNDFNSSSGYTSGGSSINNGSLPNRRETLNPTLLSPAKFSAAANAAITSLESNYPSSKSIIPNSNNRFIDNTNGVHNPLKLTPTTSRTPYSNEINGISSNYAGNSNNNLNSNSITPSQNSPYSPDVSPKAMIPLGVLAGVSNYNPNVNYDNANVNDQYRSYTNSSISPRITNSAVNTGPGNNLKLPPQPHPQQVQAQKKRYLLVPYDQPQEQDAFRAVPGSFGKGGSNNYPNYPWADNKAVSSSSPQQQQPPQMARNRSKSSSSTSRSTISAQQHRVSSSRSLRHRHFHYHHNHHHHSHHSRHLYLGGVLQVDARSNTLLNLARPDPAVVNIGGLNANNNTLSPAVSLASVSVSRQSLQASGGNVSSSFGAAPIGAAAVVVDGLVNNERHEESPSPAAVSNVAFVKNITTEGNGKVLTSSSSSSSPPHYSISPPVMTNAASAAAAVLNSLPRGASAATNSGASVASTATRLRTLRKLTIERNKRSFIDNNILTTTPEMSTSVTSSDEEDEDQLAAAAGAAAAAGGERRRAEEGDELLPLVCITKNGAITDNYRAGRENVPQKRETSSHHDKGFDTALNKVNGLSSVVIDIEINNKRGSKGDSKGKLTKSSELIASIWDRLKAVSDAATMASSSSSSLANSLSKKEVFEKYEAEKSNLVAAREESDNKSLGAEKATSEKFTEDKNGLKGLEGENQLKFNEGIDEKKDVFGKEGNDLSSLKSVLATNQDEPSSFIQRQNESLKDIFFQQDESLVSSNKAKLGFTSAAVSRSTLADFKEKSALSEPPPSATDVTKGNDRSEASAKGGEASHEGGKGVSKGGTGLNHFMDKKGWDMYENRQRLCKAQLEYCNREYNTREEYPHATLYCTEDTVLETLSGTCCCLEEVKEREEEVENVLRDPEDFNNNLDDIRQNSDIIDYGSNGPDYDSGNYKEENNDVNNSNEDDCVPEEDNFEVKYNNDNEVDDFSVLSNVGSSRIGYENEFEDIKNGSCTIDNKQKQDQNEEQSVFERILDLANEIENYNEIGAKTVEKMLSLKKKDDNDKAAKDIIRKIEHKISAESFERAQNRENGGKMNKNHNKMQNKTNSKVYNNNNYNFNYENNNGDDDIFDPFLFQSSALVRLQQAGITDKEAHYNYAHGIRCIVCNTQAFGRYCPQCGAVIVGNI